MRKLLLMIFLILATACGGGNESQKQESDEVIGTPPSPSEDPFFFVTMPAEAVAAEPTGTIGKSEATPKKADGTSTRCFSCVKVCPVESGETKCPQKDDIICGWGVHPEPDTAQQLARAECDGALDLVRESPRWSRIEGGCPAASCQ